MGTVPCRAIGDGIIVKNAKMGKMGNIHNVFGLDRTWEKSVQFPPQKCFIVA